MMMDSTNRRVSAVALVTFDGYVRMMAADERLALAVFKVQTAHIEATCALYQGRMAQQIGDSLLFVFPSAVNAVKAAMEIQLVMTDRNAGSIGKPGVHLRIGLDLAEVPQDAAEMGSVGAGLVARIQTLAVPGGITLSDTLCRVVRGHVDVKLQLCGSLRLADAGDEMSVWQVDFRRGTTAAPSASRDQSRPEPTSFFADALRRAAATQARQIDASTSGTYKIESLASGSWTIAGAFTGRQEALAAAEEKAEEEGCRVRVMEVVWDKHAGFSRSRLVSEVRGREAQHTSSLRTISYEIEAELAGRWMLVGNFASRDDAMTAARIDAAADHCKVRVVEVAWDGATGASRGKLLLEFNGALLQARKQPKQSRRSARSR